MIFIKSNYKKYHLALILFFIVGCDENLIYSRSKSDEGRIQT
jgi:hypothetical protein